MPARQRISQSHIISPTTRLVRPLAWNGDHNGFLFVQDGCTPLHLAASKDYVAVAKALLEKGADTEAKDDVVRLGGAGGRRPRISLSPHITSMSRAASGEHDAVRAGYCCVWKPCIYRTRKNLSEHIARTTQKGCSTPRLPATACVVSPHFAAHAHVPVFSLCAECRDAAALCGI